MDTYAQVLMVAIPFFILLIIIEAFYSWRIGKLSYNGMDTISSLSSGTTNTLKSVLKLSVVIVSYAWFVDKVALTEIKITWLVWLLSFIAIDFASYWSHRLNHSINIFWNQHIVHHSSEEFNLACALRQPISNIIGYGFIFLLPAALLGLPAKVIAVIAPIHLFMQFWYHTVHIPKLGWLEYLIVTPSQHRVHHAINDIYIDKNLSAIFCVWDRIFGTFQEELDEEPCVYGVKKPVITWNPIKINWMHMWQITKDAWRTKNWKDKFRVWFMPTGWRPEDVSIQYPITYEKDPHAQVKYAPASSKSLKNWSWFQYVFSTLLMIHMLTQIDKIGFPYLFVYGGFLFVLIYSYSSLMDHETKAVWIEIGKSIMGLSIIISTGSWFYLEEMLPGANLLMALYFLVSPVVVYYLSKQTAAVKVSDLSVGR
ncbi:sterol desaturase family protein [Portibacter lacus]|uniref:Sterol desaturase n=1 Tax=Portibacter lacus TaxID=1099794 RepID=A0AA37SP11_9BACT|nr:sterol desaturase family protein [Portibacter lacus]GLR17320.1 sterol desaturase [Portibacter lacus]